MHNIQLHSFKKYLCKYKICITERKKCADLNLLLGLCINASLLQFQLGYHQMKTAKQSIVFAFLLMSVLLTWLGNVININSHYSSSSGDILVSLLFRRLA
jgi:hypothetical protein